MPNIEKKFEEIKKEMSVDADGFITFTIKGVSRLSGLHENSLSFTDARINKKLEKILKEHGFDVTQWGSSGVPDKATALIVEFYAFDADTPRDIAKCSYRAFASIGIRQWGQELLGWKPPQQYSSDFQNQVLTTLAELNTKIDNQQAELALIRPAYEEMQEITPALDKFPELMPLLKEISGNIRKNPVQKKAKLKVWLEKLKIAHIVTRGQRQSIGKLVSDFLKIGKMEVPDKQGCNLYYEAMLPLIVLATQYVLFNQN